MHGIRSGRRAGRGGDVHEQHHFMLVPVGHQRADRQPMRIGPLDVSRLPALLQRLSVYRAQATDGPTRQPFEVMERKLYRGITTPAMVLTLAFGTWLWLGFGVTGGWLHAKLVLVGLFVADHFWLGRLRLDLARG